MMRRIGINRYEILDIDEYKSISGAWDREIQYFKLDTFAGVAEIALNCMEVFGKVESITALGERAVLVKWNTFRYVLMAWADGNLLCHSEVAPFLKDDDNDKT